MLHLICGPSGSGKTQYLTDAIRKDIEAGTPCLLLVPEQQLYTSEKTLPPKLPSNAGLYLEILSFTGLAEKIFRRFGGLQFLDADRGVRTLVMWSVLRSLSPLLARYGRGGAEESVVSLMQSAVEDLRINGILPESLQTASEQMGDDPLLQKKLSDLALVSSLYNEKMKQLFGEMIPEERLTRLAKRLSERSVFANTHIYVDSFTSFTWDENLVIKELIRQTEEITITLCIDELPSKRPHFRSVNETGKSLKKLADEADRPWDVKSLHRPEAMDDLSYLEENLWKFDAKPYGKTASHVLAVRCNTVYEECEAAAINILDLVHKGIRFDEIAVIVRDFDTYSGWLESALERHGIPYFLSERNSFLQKPLARLILSALRSVQYGYRATDIFSLLKTGLSGIPLRQSSLFEEYVETWHISGKSFLEDVWKMNPDGLTIRKPGTRAQEILESANEVRRKLILPLVSLSDAFSRCKTFADFCEALYTYLLTIGLADTLEEQSKKELERHASRDAQESVRLFSFLTELLGKANDVLGKEELTLEEFSMALSLLFSTADLGSVPLVNDCVTLGSASMLRLEHVRASLLLGLCEGEFPGDAAANGILSDDDKEKLTAFDLHFRSVAEIKQSEELFYVYRAVTKPTDAVILSAPKTLDSAGQSAPSIAYLRVVRLLNLKEEEFNRSLIKGALHRTEPTTSGRNLPPTQKNRMHLSPSALEEYVACPYRYHLGQTLSVRTPQDSLQGSSESGNFLHRVFERFLTAENQDEATLQSIVEEYIESICGRQIDELDAQLLHQFFRLTKIAKRMLYGQDGILNELASSGFAPIALEERGEIEVALDEQTTAVIGGQIDRIDAIKKDGKVYLRVVDYKSSRHTFVPADIPKGKELQLVLYLMAAAKKYPGAIKAGGMYVWPDETGSTLATGKDQFSIFEKYTDHGNDSLIEGYETSLLDAIKSSAKEILSGKAEKRPSKDSCKFCPAKYHCDVAIVSDDY